MYVDDILTGASHVKEAVQLRDELNKLMKTRGLKLRKWASNSPDVLTSME